MNNKDILRKLSYVLMPVSGMIFLLWYVRSAGYDVVYTDYIRLIAEYLPDVDDIRRLLVPDILTRIPATFLARFINYSSFGFSVTFDRLLAIGGIGLMAIVLALYSCKYKVGYGWQAVIFIVLFSLNKWEILLNGTAWAHVVSFGLFFINYYLMDRLWRGETGSKEELMLFLMPVLLLLIAGEYIASYAVTMIFMSLLGILMGGAGGSTRGRERSLYKGILFMTALALILYMISRHFAVWEHAGATDMSFTEAFAMNPLFLPRFLIRSFAGAVLGQETIRTLEEAGRLSDSGVLCLGLVVICAYLLAIYLYIRKGLYKKTLFPMILLLTGGMNHVLVTASRWIFLEDSYALSSRYAGQFMIGLFGILLIFGGSFALLRRGDTEQFSFALFLRPEVQYRFYAILCTATEAVFLKKAIAVSAPFTTFAVWCILSALFSTLLYFAATLRNGNFGTLRSAFSLTPRGIVLLLTLAATTGIMQFSTNVVFKGMPVAYALALFQLSALLSVFFGGVLFHEKDIARKLAASAVMIIGAVIILLA